MSSGGGYIIDKSWDCCRKLKEVNKEKQTREINNIKGGDGLINLIRVDDRLIHGQCMTRLVPHYSIKHIIVVDEFTANNSIMKMVIEKAAMPGVKNEVFNVVGCYDPITKAINDPVATMIVFRYPQIAKDIFDHVEGLPKSLMVGPVQKKDGATTIIDGTYCSKEEMKVFDYLEDNHHVDVFFQVVPDMKRTEWKDIRNTIER